MIEKIEITSRDQWLGLRKKDVTASAAAALLGEHPFLSAFEVWGNKVGKIGDPEDNKAMRRGRLLEPVVVEMLREDHPDWELIRPNCYLRDPDKRLGATPDLWARLPGGKLRNIQIKTTDQMIFRKKWLDKATGYIDLPIAYAVQTMIENDLSLADSGMVALLVVGMGLELFEIEVERHAGVMRALDEAVADFWALVDSGKPMDPDYARDHDALKRVYDSGGAPPIDLSGDNVFGNALTKLENAKAVIKAAGVEKESAEAVIFHKLGNHDACRFYDKSVTWRLQHRRETVQKASSFRVLRVS